MSEKFYKNLDSLLKIESLVSNGDKISSASSKSGYHPIVAFEYDYFSNEIESDDDNSDTSKSIPIFFYK